MTTIRGGRERGRGPDGFTINDLSKTILTLYIRQQKQIRVQLHSSFGGGTYAGQKQIENGSSKNFCNVNKCYCYICYCLQQISLCAAKFLGIVHI